MISNCGPVPLWEATVFLVGREFLEMDPWAVAQSQQPLKIWWEGLWKEEEGSDCGDIIAFQNWEDRW